MVLMNNLDVNLGKKINFVFCEVNLRHKYNKNYSR